jgi:hypothetical protein
MMKASPLAPALNEQLIYLMLVLNVLFLLGFCHHTCGDGACSRLRCDDI